MPFDFGNMSQFTNPELLRKLYGQYGNKQPGGFGGMERFNPSPTLPTQPNTMFPGGMNTVASQQNRMPQEGMAIQPSNQPMGQPVQPAQPPQPAPQGVAPGQFGQQQKIGGFSDPYENWKRQGRPGGDFNKWMAQR